MLALLFAAFLLTATPSSEADPNRLFADAVIAQQRGHYAEAVRGYQRLLQLQPDALEVKLNLGAALVQLGRFGEAIAQYQSALHQSPTNDAVRLNLALAYYKKRDFADAAEQFTVLHAAKPGDIRTAILLADCQLQTGNAAAAVNLLQPLEPSSSDSPDLTFILGSALIKTGQRQQGLLRIEKLATPGQNADAHLLAGSTLLQMDQFDKARQHVDQALQLNPSLPHIYRLAGVAHEKDGDADGAKQLLLKALAADPNDFTAHLYLGAVLYKERQLPEAGVHLRQALRLDPTSSLARYEVALLDTATGNLPAALQTLEGLAKSDPDWLEPHVQLTALYYRLHRAEDGARERSVVDHLSASQQQKGPQ